MYSELWWVKDNDKGWHFIRQVKFALRVQGGCDAKLWFVVRVLGWDGESVADQDAQGVVNVCVWWGCWRCWHGRGSAGRRTVSPLCESACDAWGGWHGKAHGNLAYKLGKWPYQAPMGVWSSPPAPPALPSAPATTGRLSVRPIKILTS